MYPKDILIREAKKYSDINIKENNIEYFGLQALKANIKSAKYHGSDSIDYRGVKLSVSLGEKLYNEIKTYDKDLANTLKARQGNQAARKAISIGLVGNMAHVLPEMLRRDVPVDIVTDQTSAHDPLAYLPLGVSLEDSYDLAEKDPVDYTKRAEEAMAKHVEAMVGFMQRGAEVFDYGNSIRDEARKGGYQDAFKFPGFIPAYIRPLFCEGKGPFRWVALSGDKKDIHTTDKAILDLFPENDHLRRWITMAQDRVQFQGLPARICWLGYGERDKAGAVFNDLVKNGDVSAPIVNVVAPTKDTKQVASSNTPIASTVDLELARKDRMMSRQTSLIS